MFPQENKASLGEGTETMSFSQTVLFPHMNVTLSCSDSVTLPVLAERYVPAAASCFRFGFKPDLQIKVIDRLSQDRKNQTNLIICPPF